MSTPMSTSISSPSSSSSTLSSLSQYTTSMTLDSQSSSSSSTNTTKETAQKTDQTVHSLLDTLSNQVKDFTLEVISQDELTDSLLNQFLQRSPQLKKLSIISCKKFTGAGLTQQHTGLLEFATCDTGIIPKGVVRILQLFPNLATLRVKGEQHIEYLAMPAHKYNTITKIDFEGSRVNSQHFIDLCAQFPNLRQCTTFFGCHSIDPTCVDAVCQQFTTIPHECYDTTPHAVYIDYKSLNQLLMQGEVTTLKILSYTHTQNHYPNSYTDLTTLSILCNGIENTFTGMTHSKQEIPFNSITEEQELHRFLGRFPNLSQLNICFNFPISLSASCKESLLIDINDIVNKVDYLFTKTGIEKLSRLLPNLTKLQITSEVNLRNRQDAKRAHISLQKLSNRKIAIAQHVQNIRRILPENRSMTALYHHRKAQAFSGKDYSLQTALNSASIKMDELRDEIDSSSYILGNEMVAEKKESKEEKKIES